MVVHEESVKSDNVKFKPEENQNENELVLYCYHHCFHSQKVMKNLINGFSIAYDKKNIVIDCNILK